MENSALGGKSCVITLLVGGKAVRWNTGLQEAVFACFLKNIMLHKNWKFILECAAQDKKKGKQKSTIISTSRNSYYYHFSLHTLRILSF